LLLTFGGMCSCRSFAVARVFALVMRCRIMRLLLISRVGKNRDTKWGDPAAAGASPANFKRSFYWLICFGRKAIAYTDLLGLGLLY